MKSLSVLNEKVKENDYEAICELARWYRLGFEVEKDIEKAISLCKSAIKINSDGEAAHKQLGYCYDVLEQYEKAWEEYSFLEIKGYPDAIALKGEMYEYGKYVERDPKLALEMYKKSAENGGGYGCQMLGVVYSCGILGEERDYDKEFFWFEKALKYGYNFSNVELGRCYQYGRGCNANYEKARMYYEKGVEDLDRIAAARLSNLLINIDFGFNDIEAGIAYLKIAAKWHHAEALFDLGLYYYEGEYIEKDFEMAEQCFKESAELGNADAIFNLSKQYFVGKTLKGSLSNAELWAKKGVEIGEYKAIEFLYDALEDKEGESYNIEKSFELKKYAADKGNIRGKYEVAISLIEGYGVEKDVEKGIVLLRESAEEGYALAICSLGLTYENGEYVEKDLNKAEELYIKAAEAGSIAANIKMYELYRNEDSLLKQKQGVEYLEKAAELGDINAISILGIVYSEGLYGKEKDVAKAIELWEDAANYDESDAIRNLGIKYMYGDGVEVDIEKAEEYFEKALNLSNYKAAINLGILNENVKKIANYEKAINYYEIAAKEGLSEAEIKLGSIYYDGMEDFDFEGRSVEKDTDKAYRYFESAADKGNLNGIKGMAIVISNGWGTDKDKQKTVKLLLEMKEKGQMDNSMQNKLIIILSSIGNNESFTRLLDLANKGVVEAQEEVAHAYLHGIGVNEDIDESMKWDLTSAENGSFKGQAVAGMKLVIEGKEEKDFTLGLQYLESAGKAGFRQSFQLYYSIYAEGFLFDKIPVDKDKALKFVTECAEMGLPYAQYTMAQIYDHGNGDYEELIDKSKAVDWYEKAVNNNVTDAMVDFGISYKTGDGVEQNYEKAIELFKNASELGNLRSNFLLATLYGSDKTPHKNVKNAKDYLDKIINRDGNEFKPEAYSYLAAMNVEECDYDEALNNIDKALNMDNITEEQTKEYKGLRSSVLELKSNNGHELDSVISNFKKSSGNKTLNLIVIAIILVVVLLFSITNCGSDNSEYNGGYYNDFESPYYEEYSKDFYLPYSSSEYYSESEIDWMSEEEVQWAINEIYARHGRIFQSEPYSSYFAGCDWYYGEYTADEFDETSFNDYEMGNIQMLVKYAEENGWR